MVHKEPIMAEPSAAVSPRFREYETVYLLRPDIDKAGAAKVAQRIEDVVGRLNGKLTLVETWGRRQLSHAIGRTRRAVYIYVKYVGGADIVAEIERNLRMLDDVLKYQTVLVNPAVDLASLQIEADAVRFEEIDLPEELEDERALERALGFVEPEPRMRPTEDEYTAEEPEPAAPEAKPAEATEEASS